MGLQWLIKYDTVTRISMDQYNRLNLETYLHIHEKLIVETINKRKGCNCHLYKISREKYSF